MGYRSFFYFLDTLFKRYWNNQIFPNISISNIIDRFFHITTELETDEQNLYYEDDYIDFGKHQSIESVINILSLNILEILSTSILSNTDDWNQKGYKNIIRSILFYYFSKKMLHNAYFIDIKVNNISELQETIYNRYSELQESLYQQYRIEINNNQRLIIEEQLNSINSLLDKIRNTTHIKIPIVFETSNNSNDEFTSFSREPGSILMISLYQSNRYDLTFSKKGCEIHEINKQDIVKNLRNVINHLKVMLNLRDDLSCSVDIELTSSIGSLFRFCGTSYLLGFALSYYLKIFGIEANPLFAITGDINIDNYTIEPVDKIETKIKICNENGIRVLFIPFENYTNLKLSNQNSFEQYTCEISNSEYIKSASYDVRVYSIDNEDSNLELSLSKIADFLKKMNGNNLLNINKNISETKLFGRELEKEKLQHIINKGFGSILICGDTGIGKTSLAKWFINELINKTHAICYSITFEKDIKINGIKQLLIDLFGVQFLDVQNTKEKIIFFLNKYKIKANSDIILNIIDGLSSENKDIESSNFFDENLFGVFNLLNDLPFKVILFFDDLQWSDDNTLKFLLYSIKSIINNPYKKMNISFVLIHKNDYENKEHINALKSLFLKNTMLDYVFYQDNLSNLEKSNIKELLSDRGYENGSDDIVDYLILITNGNPLHIMLVINLLESKNSIYNDKGLWKISSNFESNFLADLYRLIEYKLSEFIPNNSIEITLNISSILGPSFSKTFLKYIYSKFNLNDDFDYIIEILKSKNIIKGKVEFSFYHSIFKEIILEKLKEMNSKKTIIEIVIESYKEFYSEIVNNYFPEIALLYELKEEYQTAIKYYYAFAEELKKKDIKTAFKYYDKIIVLKDKTNVLTDKCILDKCKAMSYVNESYTECDKYDYYKALNFCEKAINLCHNDEIIYDLMGYIYYNLGKLDRIVEPYKKSLEIKLELFKEDNEYIAKAYHNLGKAYFLINDFENSLIYHNKALDIRKKVFGKYSLEVADSIDRIAGVYRVKGLYEQSITKYNQAIDIVKSNLGENHINIGFIYNNLALSSIEDNNAIHFFSNALKIYYKTIGKNNMSTVVLYSNIGMYYRRKKLYQKAIKYYNKAINITIKLMEEESYYSGFLYNNLGVVYEKLGEYEKALESYKKAEYTWNNLFKGNYLCVGNLYNNIGVSYECLKLYDKAITNYNKALDIYLSVLGENNNYASTLYNNLGELFYNQKFYDKAIEYHLKSLNISKNLFGENHKYVADSHFKLSNVYRAISNEEMYSFHYNKALEIEENIKKL